MEKTAIYYTWEEFDRDSKLIAQWARKHDFKSVYGIPIGGVALALVVSHQLNLWYLSNEQGIDEHTLIVDDIIDSGERDIRLAGELGSRNNMFASLYFKHGAVYVPDYYVHPKEVDWIYFPWETAESSKYDGN